MERDRASAAAEYGAQFRGDIESFITREAVEACVAVGVHERAPVFGVSYTAFVDPSGGSVDSMAMAIGHRQDGATIIDAMRERRPPFSPEDVVGEFAALLRHYRISKVTGDRYGGEWPRERFRAFGIAYEPAGKAKSDIYRELLPVINSRQVELLDDPRLVAQIVGLERRTGRGGRDSIDHAPGGHDDLCNAVAGVIAETELMLGSSAEAWIAFYGKLAAEASGHNEGQRKLSGKEDEDNSVIEAYERIARKCMDKTIKCAWCGEEIEGGSRTTDGADSYHEDSYRTMLTKDRRVAS